MKMIQLVALREFKSRAFTKVSVITLLVWIILLVGGGWALGKFAGLDEINVTKIALDSSAQPLGQAFKVQAKPGEDIFEISACQAATCEKLVKDKQVEYAIMGEATQPLIVSREPVSLRFSQLVTQAATSLQLAKKITELGGNPAELAQDMAAVKVKIKDLSALKNQSRADKGFNMASYIASLLIAILLFGSVMGSGQLVAMGVVEEKSSRVVEVLLATVRPSHLLTGKILGISINSLMQLALMGGAGVLGLHLSKVMANNSLDLAGISWWVLVWCLLGLATYMALYAGIGALVSRQEEVGTTTLPLLFFQLAIVYAAIFGSMSDPNALWLRIMSLFPFANCYVMPMRQVYGAVPTLDLVISIGANLVAIPLIVWLGATLYRRGILHTGGSLSIRKAIFASAR